MRNIPANIPVSGFQKLLVAEAHGKQDSILSVLENNLKQSQFYAGEDISIADF
jgi:glutathione S-transferase